MRHRFVTPQGIACPSWNLNDCADTPDGAGGGPVLTAEATKLVVLLIQVNTHVHGRLCLQQTRARQP
jgi:hypothetical protein